jgi:hypothetical protein
MRWKEMHNVQRDQGANNQLLPYIMAKVATWREALLTVAHGDTHSLDH